MSETTGQEDNGFESLISGLFNKKSGGARGLGLIGTLLMGLIFGFGADGNPLKDIGHLLGLNSGEAKTATAPTTGAVPAPNASVIPDALKHPIDTAEKTVHHWLGRDKPVVAVLGDSLGNGTAQALSKKFNVVNEAHDGFHLSQVTPDQVAAVPQGAACLISIGTNDVRWDRALSDREAKAYADQVIGLANKVKTERGANVAVTAMALDGTPRGQTWNDNMALVNKYVAADAQANGIGFVAENNITDWSQKDHIHHGAKGYGEMAANAIPVLGLNA